MDKARINNKIYDIITDDEYKNNKNLYDPSFTAIKKEGTIYPLRKKKDTSPGYYDLGVIGFYVSPSDDEKDLYNSINSINFSDSKSIKDIIEKSDNLKEIEKDILTTADNIFIPKIKENDEPEMIALKESVISKNIDIGNYEHRFGGKYNNDIRIFQDNSITLFKLKKFADALDLKCTLTIEDKNPDVANPMNRAVTVVLNDGDDIDEWWHNSKKFHQIFYWWK